MHEIYNSPWLQGLIDCELQYSVSGLAPNSMTAPPGCKPARLDYANGWNAYRTHILGAEPKLPGKLAKRLERIDLAYAHLVVNLDYGKHSELSILAQLQQLRQRRLKARTNAMRYYHAS